MPPMTGTAPTRTPRTQSLVPRMAAIASTTARPGDREPGTLGLPRVGRRGDDQRAHGEHRERDSRDAGGRTSQATITEAIAMTTMA